MSESSARSARATHIAIRRAALSLFEREGYANVTVAQVAASAQVDPMTVYRHFGTKHGLVLRLGDDAGTPQRVGEAIAAAALPGGSLLDTVEAAATQWVQEASRELLEEAFRVTRLTTNTPELRIQAWNNVSAWAQTYQPWVAGLMPDVEPHQAELASRIAIDVVVAAGLDWASSSGDKPAALSAIRSAVAVAQGVSRG